VDDDVVSAFILPVRLAAAAVLFFALRGNSLLDRAASRFR
jgi:hypothetical protein